MVCVALPIGPRPLTSVTSFSPSHFVLRSIPVLSSLTFLPSGANRVVRPSADVRTTIERKTKWDGEKLVTEVSGLGPMGKATQTIAADPESHQLRIVLQMEGGRQADGRQAAAGNSAQGRGPRTITHVYDDDKYAK